MEKSLQMATTLPKLWELFLQVLEDKESGRFTFEERGIGWTLVVDSDRVFLEDTGLDTVDGLAPTRLREKPARLLKDLIQKLDNLSGFACHFQSIADPPPSPSIDLIGPISLSVLVDSWIHKVEIPAEDTVEEEEDSSLVRMDILLMFRRKIGEGLLDDPLDLDVEDHRPLLVEALATMGSMNHFERLEINERFTAEELARAFESKARLVHPNHAEALGFKSNSKALDLLFELVTESYLVLNDPNRLRAYLADFGSAFTVQELSDEAREKEVQEQLDYRFDLAKRGFQRGDFHRTASLMTEILKTESKPEYWALLAEVQSKNHLWIEKSIESYRMAIELAPFEISYLFRLAEICEENGREELALRYYHKVLEKDSTHPAASEAIANLGSSTTRSGSGAIPPALKNRGLVDWILGLLGLKGD